MPPSAAWRTRDAGMVWDRCIRRANVRRANESPGFREPISMCAGMSNLPHTEEQTPLVASLCVCNKKEKLRDAVWIRSATLACVCHSLVGYIIQARLGQSKIGRTLSLVHLPHLEHPTISVA